MNLEKIKAKQVEVIVYLQERIKVSSIPDDMVQHLTCALATAIESLHRLDHWGESED